MKEARYLALTTPRPRSSKNPPIENGTGTDPISSPGLNRTASEARQKWSRVGKIARRAGGDEESSLSSSPSENDNSNPSHNQQGEARHQRQKKRLAEKQDRVDSAKQMDLSYFLEMVDVKHRYGSNLRKYHKAWKEAATTDNFFYWLDEGEGRDAVVENCSRERLENMQVRYLGKEERRLYEVVVDAEGKLCWRKDGLRVDTSERWKDSVRGVVKVDDPTLPWAHRPAPYRGSSESSGLSSKEEEPGISSPTGPSSPNLKDTTTKESREAHIQAAASSPTSPTVPRHASFHNLFHSKSDKKEKTPPKPKQKWIFVADTNNNLYIGIKQSGAFQHSSFLRGSRISAAGLITVKDGQLRILQPRSGHYRTPSHNLRIFIKSLQARGVDMSMTAVGGSYAAMVGIETYMKTKGRLKGLREGLRALSFKGEGGKEGGK